MLADNDKPNLTQPCLVAWKYIVSSKMSILLFPYLKSKMMRTTAISNYNHYHFVDAVDKSWIKHTMVAGL